MQHQWHCMRIKVSRGWLPGTPREAEAAARVGERSHCTKAAEGATRRTDVPLVSTWKGVPQPASSEAAVSNMDTVGAASRSGLLVRPVPSATQLLSCLTGDCQLQPIFVMRRHSTCLAVLQRSMCMCTLVLQLLNGNTQVLTSSDTEHACTVMGSSHADGIAHFCSLCTYQRRLPSWSQQLSGQCHYSENSHERSN